MFAREKYTPESLLDSVKCILLDIEGTTTSSEFIKNELVPYARKHLAEYVYKHWDDEMKEIADLLISEPLDPDISVEDSEFASADINVKEEFQGAVLYYLEWQMKHNCKSTALKKLQGYMWTIGYNEGLLKGHVYEDVPVALKQWKEAGKKIYIYSSGSIEAQKLLFRNSIAGDLDKFIDENFDLSIGSKRCTESYRKIFKQLGEKPDDIVFISDDRKELHHARLAYMKTLMIDREQVGTILKLEEPLRGMQGLTEPDYLYCLNSFLPTLKKA